MDLFSGTVYLILYILLASVLMVEFCSWAPRQMWKGVNKDEAHSTAKPLRKMLPRFLLTGLVITPISQAETPRLESRDNISLGLHDQEEVVHLFPSPSLYEPTYLFSSWTERPLSP